MVALSHDVPLNLANPLDSSWDGRHRIRSPDAVRQRVILCATRRVEPTQEALGCFTRTSNKGFLRNPTRGNFLCTNIRRSLNSPPRNQRTFRDVRSKKGNGNPGKRMFCPFQPNTNFPQDCDYSQIICFLRVSTQPPAGLVAAVYAEPAIRLQLKQRFALSSGAPYIYGRRSRGFSCQ